jgi:hypothetical protein
MYFIDDVMHEVHAKHSGITLMGPCDETAGQLVAAMQFDDFVAVCGSLDEVKAVARTMYEYSCKWPVKLNTSMRLCTCQQLSNQASWLTLVLFGIVFPCLLCPRNATLACGSTTPATETRTLRRCWQRCIV